MQPRLRTLPAWAIVLVFGLAESAVLAASGATGIGSSGRGSTAVALGVAILVAFAVVLAVRGDGNGWNTYAITLATRTALRFVHWSLGFEVAVFVVVTSGATWLAFDRHRAPAPVTSEGSAGGALGEAARPRAPR